MDRYVEVEAEVTIKVRARVHVYTELYGADADGRRGEMRTYAEVEKVFELSDEANGIIDAAMEDAAIEQEQD